MRGSAQGAGRPLVVAVFLGLWAFSVFDAGLVNDHFDRMTRGRQILEHGEVPFRDFFDPGYFLTVYSSAAVQSLFGYRLLGEVLLDTLFIAAGFTLVFVLATRASQSRMVGFAALALAVASAPRLYDYDKVFFYPLGILACWRYIDRPTAGSLAWLGLVTAAGGLYRYDTAVYVAGAVSVTILAGCRPQAGGICGPCRAGRAAGGDCRPRPGGRRHGRPPGVHVCPTRRQSHGHPSSGDIRRLVAGAARGVSTAQR